MSDIATREDVQLLVTEFYKKVRSNETLNYIFDDVIRINWEHHVPILVDFWESMLLDANKYSRNTMAIHFGINEKVKLESRHFSTWLHLFDLTVDELFAGPKATLAKQRAHAIAQVMQIKMQNVNQR